MRVLFATDGSQSASLARDLLASLAWPDGTRFRVVSVVEDRHRLPHVLGGDELEGDVGAVARHVELTLDDAVRALERPGRPVDRIVLEGRAASAILEEARGFGAQLIALGSHGHSRIAAMLLGSTSAEVAARSHCPVLVARDREIRSIVLGCDSSVAAGQAEAVLSRLPLRHLPVSVVSVASSSMPLMAVVPGPMATGTFEASVRAGELARDAATQLADSTVQRLGLRGIRAEAHGLSGDAATELVSFAAERPGSLLVVGSRAHGGIAKAVLGGVARNVLQHASGSVLVVPETESVLDGRRDRDAVLSLGTTARS